MKNFDPNNDIRYFMTKRGYLLRCNVYFSHERMLSMKDKPTAKEDLKILQKVFDMIMYAYTVLAQYPKSEKFALVADIKRVMDEMLELTIEAQKKYFKKTTLQELDVCIAKLKAYIRLSFNLKFVSLKKYEVWSGMVVEIGKMLGGWLKSVNGKTAEHRA